MRFLDKAVEKRHVASRDAKQHTGNAAPREAASNFPKSITQTAAQRHADRPRKFHVFDVFADYDAVCLCQFQKPVANRLAARRKCKKIAGSRFMPSMN